MGNHPNLDLYVKIVTAFNAGDLEVVNEHLTADFCFRRFGQARVSGVYEGAQAMIDHLRQLKDETDGTITLKPEVAVADHAAVMVYGHATATRNGRQLDIHNAYVWRLRDGKFCEANLIANDQRAEAEFWA